MTSRGIHVVIGGGQIGSLTAALLAQRGERARQVYRRPKTVSTPGVATLLGDLHDSAFAAKAAEGASVVYDCSNPRYDQWGKLLLPLGRNVMRGARDAGACLVALDNLYMYGRPAGPMSPESPIQPCSRKGTLRAQLASERLQAHQRGELPVAILRASDYYGVGVTNALFGDHFFRRVLAGKSAQIFGDPDVAHSYTYGPDVAAMLVRLGGDDRACGKVWHTPTAPAESTRALIERFGTALGRRIPIFVAPQALLRVIGIFDPIMRENMEMTYQWQIPYVLDSAKTEEIFQVSPTPFDIAVPATLAWAKTHYAKQ